MKKIEISKENVEQAYKTANDNNVKNVLRALFGNAVEEEKPQLITDRVKSYEDACRELGLIVRVDFEDEEPADIAYEKLKVIAQALNEGWKPQFKTDEYRYYPWFWLYTKKELKDMKEDEKKERRMLDITDLYVSDYAGFGSATSGYAPSFAYAYIGSRLCLKDSDLALYCGKQFIELWADFYLTRK